MHMQCMPDHFYSYMKIYYVSLSLFEFYSVFAAAKSLQLCPTLCDPIDGSPPGSAIPGILQARTLEWVAISFSNAWKWKVKVKSLSRVRLFTTPWTAAYQAPLSMGFSRQEYWSGVPLPSPIQYLLRYFKEYFYPETIQISGGVFCLFCLSLALFTFLKPPKVALVVKNPSEMWVWSLGYEDPLEKGMATYPGILA